MVDYYVDSATGNNADDGLTQANAWATIQFAVENATVNAGDIIHVRRGHSEIPTSDIQPVNDGTKSSPVIVQSWARPTIPDTTITEATWTNGSTTVDLIVGITVARSSHQGRFATAPDGKKYLITRVVDTNTIIIDREYAGSTVTGTNGKFQIEADEWTNPTDVDGWDSDALTMPLIDFNSTAFTYDLSLDDYNIIKGIEFKNSTNSNGNIRLSGLSASMIGCLTSQTENIPCVSVNSEAYIERVIMEGNATGTNQRGLVSNNHSSVITMKNCAIYNMGDVGIFIGEGDINIENVNIGVEQANGDSDILESLNVPSESSRLIAKDLKLGGTNGDITFLTNNVNKHTKFSIENHQKILDSHKTWYRNGTWSNVNVGDTDAPSVASTSGNAIDLIELIPDVSSTTPIELWADELFVHEFDAQAASKTYTYYLQNFMGVTLNSGDAKGDIWLKAEYIDSYNDNTAYTRTELFSAETNIAARADNTDWDSLSVTVQPAVASRVRITCYISTYSATGKIYIDPLVVIS